MADLSNFFNAIKQQQAELAKEYPDGFLHVTSVKNILRSVNAGTVSEVNLRIGAQHIVEGTARPSTEAEIEAHRQRGVAFTDRMIAEEQKRNAQAMRFVNFIPGPAK